MYVLKSTKGRGTSLLQRSQYIIVLALQSLTLPALGRHYKSFKINRQTNMKTNKKYF